MEHREEELPYIARLWSSPRLVHLLHVAVGWCGALSREAEEVRGDLLGQRGRSFGIQVGPKQRLGRALLKK